MTTVLHRFSWSILWLWLPWVAGVTFLVWILFLNVPLSQSVKRSCTGTVCSRGMRAGGQPLSVNVINPPGAQLAKVAVQIQADQTFTSSALILSAHKDLSDPLPFDTQVSQSADGWTLLSGEVQLPTHSTTNKWYLALITKPKKIRVGTWSIQFKLSPSYLNKLYSWWQQTRS